MSAAGRIGELEARVSGLHEALSLCVRVIVAGYMAEGMAVPAPLRAFQDAEAEAEAARIMATRPARHLSVVKS